MPDTSTLAYTPPPPRTPLYLCRALVEMNLRQVFSLSRTAGVYPTLMKSVLRNRSLLDPEPLGFGSDPDLNTPKSCQSDRIQLANKVKITHSRFGLKIIRISPKQICSCLRGKGSYLEILPVLYCTVTLSVLKITVG